MQSSEVIVLRFVLGRLHSAEMGFMCLQRRGPAAGEQGRAGARQVPLVRHDAQ